MYPAGMHFVYTSVNKTCQRGSGFILKMTVLLFSSELRKAEHQLRQILQGLGQGVEVYRSIRRFAKRFERPRGDLSLIILLIPNHEILSELIAMRDQMYDLPIALMLPDSNRKTILIGHQFYPRFITFTDTDYQDLTLTLQNIISRDNRLINRAIGGNGAVG